MQRVHQSRDGYSLVELLVVIAIFAALVGLAIPTINRAGGFSRDDANVAARQLFASLKAARIYATTYRVDTAVIYGLAERTDSGTNLPVTIIDSYGVGRRMSRDELRAMGLPIPAGTNLPFMIVQDYEAKFRKLPVNACVLSINNAYDPISGVAVNVNNAANTEGLVPVLLYDIDGVLISPVKPVPGLPNTFPENTWLPAHVFTPAGTMEPQTSPVARFTLNVAPLPDASQEDRFTIHPGDIDPDTGNPAPDGVLKVPARIELFRTTGRVKMTS